MHITSSFARRKPCHLLRESYWENGQVKKRTLANLSALPQPIIDLLRQALRNELPAADPETAPIRVRTVRQHGAVSAILSMVSLLGFEDILYHKACPKRSRALAMIVCRLLAPRSMQIVERELGPSGQTTLAALLDLHDTSADDLRDALGWLADRQTQIERKLARCHLQQDSLALCEVTSRCIDDLHTDRPQIALGLLCSPDGCPVAMQSFADDCTASDSVASQVARLRVRFGLQRVALVGDYDTIALARGRAAWRANEVDWITALPDETIRDLADRKLIRRGLFDSSGWVSIAAPDFPSERLLVRFNPKAAAEQHRRREQLLEITENTIRELAVGFAGGKFSQAEFNRRVGALRRETMSKHFRWTFDNVTRSFCWESDTESIKSEARLDGLDGFRTSLSPDELGDSAAVTAYESLAHVERAFRSLEAEVSSAYPNSHEWDKRARALGFVCMLAYYLEWHLRQRWAPLLPDSENGAGPGGSAGAADRRATEEELTVQSFPDLLGDLATLTTVELEYTQVPGYVVPTLSELTPLQRRAFELLEAEPHPAPGLSGQSGSEAGSSSSGGASIAVG